jgi:anti-anti-sigma regulatory factor
MPPDDPRRAEPPARLPGVDPVSQAQAGQEDTHASRREVNPRLRSEVVLSSRAGTEGSFAMCANVMKDVAVIQTPVASLSHTDARRIFDLAVCETARMVVIDMKRVQDATTAAFATLVLLRRTLLRTGRDLLLVGLHDRAALLFGINRLEAVLPCG